MPFDFIQPQFKWALAGLAIPIVIHLMFRRRSRKVDLGTLRFLRLVLTENARRRKLKRWLLLALRMACIALLAGLFARPFLLARDATGKERLVAILIDRSASMQLKERGKRLIDLAVEQATDVINKYGERTQFEVAFFDQAARPVGNDTAAAADAKDKTVMSATALAALVKAPAELHWATNYGTALAWARDLCLNSPHGRKELYIYTDLQRSGLDWTDVEPVPADVQVHLVDLGKSAVNNVAITTAVPARHVVRPGESVGIQASVFNAGPFPLEKMPVVLTLECEAHKHVLRERLSLEPQATGTVAFEVPALTEGLWRGIVRIETEDDLPFDNQRFVGLLCTPPLGVLLADGDPRDVPQLSETFYLEKSLRLAPPGEIFADSPYRPAAVPLAEGDRLADPSSQRIVVLANVGTLSKGDATALAKFVEAGGRLIVFTGDRVAAEGYRAAAAAGLCVGEIGSVLHAHELPYRFDRWDEDHPLFEPFNDPQHGDLRRFAFSACTRIVPGPDAQVVAWFRGEIPALIEKKLGKGQVLWFTSACDREWSSWTSSRLYLPFMHQVLGYMAGLTAGGPVRDVLIDSISTLPADVVPGIFEHDGYTAVVNTGARESETDRCTREEFANRFQLTLDDTETAQEVRAPVQSLVLTGDLRDDEIWHWVILVLLSFLLVEGLVANRTAA
ncbi:MAG TPA: BatA domain-containing protein [Planctomycetaceae bacterium]|jgi:hypothetical protein